MNLKSQAIYHFPTLREYQSLKPHSQRLEGGCRIKGKVKVKFEDEQPLVSIITVVFNDSKTIEQTILSVINQSYKNIEYIIVDGSSTDGTLELIKKYEDIIAYWISEPDRGIYDAMNKGISLCKGKLVGILNSGDTYTEEAVKLAVGHYQQNPNELLIGNGKIYSHDLSYWMILSGSLSDLPYKVLPHPSIFVPLSIYEKYGIFDINYKLAADYDFLSRCYVNSVTFIHIDEIFTHISARGASSNYYLVATEYLKIRIRHKFPLIKSISSSLLSFTTITIHLSLEKLGLWSIVEKIRHQKIRHS